LNKDKIGQEPRGISMVDSLLNDEEAQLLTKIEQHSIANSSYSYINEWAMKNPLKAGETYRFST
jgi:hypothetical protein